MKKLGQQCLYVLYNTILPHLFKACLNSIKRIKQMVQVYKLFVFILVIHEDDYCYMITAYQFLYLGCYSSSFLHHEYVQYKYYLDQFKRICYFLATN